MNAIARARILGRYCARFPGRTLVVLHRGTLLAGSIHRVETPNYPFMLVRTDNGQLADLNMTEVRFVCRPGRRHLTHHIRKS